MQNNKHVFRQKDKRTDRQTRQIDRDENSTATLEITVVGRLT